MSDDEKVIATPEEAAHLDPGQWVEDADGEFWCLFQTHIIVHQWMWKAKSDTYMVSLESIPYPLSLCDIDEPEDACAHKRVQECGQCYRCGRVVGDTERWRRMEFDVLGTITTAPSTGTDRSTE